MKTQPTLSDVKGRRIRFIDLEQGPNLSGGFMEVQGFIPFICELNQIVRMDTGKFRWTPHKEVFLAITFSHLLRPEDIPGRWARVHTEKHGYYYPWYYRDYCYGPFLHDCGAISFFHCNESHFVTIFPKGVFIPPRPIAPDVKRELWSLLHNS